MGKRWARGQFCDLIPTRFKDTIFGVCLRESCKKHDVHYWKKDISRFKADNQWFKDAIWQFTIDRKRTLGFLICIPAYILLRIGGWIMWFGLDEKIINFFKINQRRLNMAKKVKVIGPFKIDKEGAKKIGKSFLLTIASAAVATLGQLFGVIDFGSYSNLAVILVPFALNTLKKWLGTYESK